MSLSPIVVLADVSWRCLFTITTGVTSVHEEILSDENVRLVLCSSMTRAELQMGQHYLGINEPFICESGAAFFVPGGYFPFAVPCDREVIGYQAVEFRQPYSDVVASLHRTAERTGVAVVGFSDLSVDEVARECDLPLSQARLARLREYDEPFRLVNFRPDSHKRLWRGLRAAGLERTCDGLHEHVGAPAGRGTAVTALMHLYRRAFGRITMVSVQADSAPIPTGIAVRADWVEGIVHIARCARNEARDG
jgi:mannosyl-3-phosphoglycerate phosphatase